MENEAPRNFQVISTHVYSFFQVVLPLRRRQLRERAGVGKEAARVRPPRGLVPRQALHPQATRDPRPRQHEGEFKFEFYTGNRFPIWGTKMFAHLFVPFDF